MKGIEHSKLWNVIDDKVIRLLSIDKDDDNELISKIAIDKSSKWWYIFLPWKWSALLRGGTTYIATFRHPSEVDKINIGTLNRIGMSSVDIEDLLYDDFSSLSEDMMQLITTYILQTEDDTDPDSDVGDIVSQGVQLIERPKMALEKIKPKN